MVDKAQYALTYLLVPVGDLHDWCSQLVSACDTYGPLIRFDSSRQTQI